jgi:hypothetical protein
MTGKMTGKMTEPRTALCQSQGELVLMNIVPAASGEGHCPDCGGDRFREGPHGWVECCTDGCGFAVVKEHIRQSTATETLTPAKGN